MTDEELAQEPAPEGSRNWGCLMAVVAVVVVFVLIGIGVFVLGGDDDSDDIATVTTDSPAPASEPAATEPPATEPAVTESPVTEPAATEPAVTEPAATEPPATEPAVTEPPGTEPAATGPAMPDPFGGIFDDLDLFLLEDQPAGEVLAAAPDDIDDVVDCDAGTGLMIDGPDISGVAATTDGTMASVSVLMDQPPTTTAEGFSFALLLQTLTQANVLHTFQWEIHDGVETIGRVDDQGNVDPAGADITLDDRAVRFTFPIDPTDPIAALFARGFNTPSEGEAKGCDSQIMASIDYPVPPTDVPGNCTADETTACLNNERFGVQALGPGGPIPIVATGSGDTAGFRTEDVDGWVRVLDGCDFNDHFWVFAAAATGVDFDLVITDTATNETFTQPVATPAQAITDTTVFATCP